MGAKLLPVAPKISVQVVPLGLDCHCTVQVPVPPLGVAFNVTFPPIQTLGAVVVTDTEGSATTLIVAVSMAVGQPVVV